VIDLSRYLNGVKVDPEKKVAYVGGGALWETVDRTAIKHGLATVGGAVNHVGCLSPLGIAVSSNIYFIDWSWRVSPILPIHMIFSMTGPLFNTLQTPSRWRFWIPIPLAWSRDR